MGISHGNSSANGSALSGVIENSRTHACAFSNGGAGTTFAASRFENSPFPRSLCSRLKLYNADFNSGIFGSTTAPSNAYFMP